MKSNLLNNISKSSTNVLIGAKGLSIAQTAAIFSQKKPVLFVAPDKNQAEDFLQDMRFLFGPKHKEKVLYLPSYDKTPYHITSPDPIVVMERLATLHKLATQTPFSVLVTSPEALTNKTVPLEYLQNATEIIEEKGHVEREELLRRLELLGYNKVTLVEDAGTYACRGSIIDVFWPGSPHPVRIDLFGNEVERINTFDAESQTTIQVLKEFQFGPVKEIELNDKTISRSEDVLRNIADELNFPTKKLRARLEDLNNHIPFFGIESLLPAFHEKLESPLELVLRVYGENSFYITQNDSLSFSDCLNTQQKEFNEHFESAILRKELCFETNRFLLDQNEIEKLLQKQSLLQIEPFESQLNLKDTKPTFAVKSTATDALRQDILKQTRRTDSEEATPHHLLEPLTKKIRELYNQNYIVFLPASSLGNVHRYIELLKPHGIQIQQLATSPNFLDENLYVQFKNPSIQAYTFIAKPEVPAHGAIFEDYHFALFAENDIFGKQAKRKGKTSKKGGFKTTLADLEDGDLIVHVDHGIGIFHGLVRLNVQGVEQDYLHLSYLNKDKLYLPVHRINLVQTYSGAEKQPRLDKLGGSGWQTKKKKVKEAVLAMAQDLLNLYAQRELAKRPHFAPPDENYWQFEAEFPFETTPDQQKAIDDVLGDLQKDRPMDRLICGDVGYGKTEVAMRAAMLTGLSNRQVAVLAPTTVLAQQHGITFTERFKNTGLRIAVVSRFQKPKEIKETIKLTKEGKVDILIGTHRILSADVSFKNLGLVVVDEEQRFGIKHKEHLKKLRTHVDVMTLSATPIPRTLEMGFFGIRDLSIIETPPVDRRAIRTSITRFDDEAIREAILMELGRQGQVYFVHNKVSSINATADYLRNLVPEAKIEVGHGQMKENDLEKVMVRFMSHEFNVLVCTTIIETGIDVPAANTMFVDNADDFGLAQLYQLRGRIGRSKERAFAYLLIPSDTDQLTPIARKRLEILHRFSELGAGFRIAQHDLELRGAGDLLGKNQHGHVAAVGYDLYSELLKESVEELKGRVHQEVFDPDIKIPQSAFISDKYVPDLHSRMSYYQKLATAENIEEIWNVVGLMSDQCGNPPQEVHALAEVMILKQLLKKLAIRTLEFINPTELQQLPRIVLTLTGSHKINFGKLDDWVSKNSARIILTEKMKLVYTPSLEEWQIACNKNTYAQVKSVIRQIDTFAI